MIAKQKIQTSEYQKRERNFIKTVTSESTFQLIVGNDKSDTLMLWQDEYYMEEYLNSSGKDIVLSKIDTIEFLKFIKLSNSNHHFFIHPVKGEKAPTLSVDEISKKIIEKLESDGDYYDSLRENNLL
ncbi:hypothetical protein [Zobellia sp. 1_MG-2023]|uniref:hypothetical protein n=1 Tax=Zobellia sp. 1_MG-2023 TaxID=3062626 RepID=UPI0026E16472|nr:hypothetical protein [Zobellia sp. 1_MG-2023]MDO6819038.1 hypothetical protein [Zobellia sp. 1_MG-2023]